MEVLFLKLLVQSMILPLPFARKVIFVNGVTEHDVEIQITYSFGVNDLFYITDVTITNRGSRQITDVRFVRSFDPDQDQQTKNTYYTYNKVICNPDPSKPGSDTNYAMVVARGSKTYSGFFFLAFDNRARASRNANSEFSPKSAYLTDVHLMSM